MHGAAPSNGSRNEGKPNDPEWREHSLKVLLLSQRDPTPGESQPVGNVAVHRAVNHSRLHVKTFHHIRHSHNWGIYTKEDRKVKVDKKD